jgi:tetratricopeptide (TPR) repeat protein
MTPMRRLLLPLLFWTLGLTGCGQPVREDRSIRFSDDGQQAAFQHGQEGVFIVEDAGAAPKKIFQPGPDVVAVSPPLWSPTDKRLLFTTARVVEKPASKPTPREPDPAGDLYTEKPTLYTCWLRPEAKDGKEAEPVALFEAACDHPGYVAANLAARWHPSGKQVLHVKQTEPGRHGLFAYDLDAKTSTQVFPYTAEALVFDWAPDREHLACVLGSRREAGAHDGIWVARPGVEEWWHVPGSEVRAAPELPALLESLRAMLPVWTADSTRFAFRVPRPGAAGQQAPVHALRVATLAGRKVETVAEDVIRDLHWRPDGSGLGFVRGEGVGTLLFLRPGGPALPEGPGGVSAFAGWDAQGKQSAYVGNEPIPGAADSWAFLLVPEPRARQAVFVRKEGGAEPGRRVFGGMQVTFPRWSPGEARLSLWATFRPPYRSWPSLLLEMGASADDPLQGLRLRAGDPALLLDSATGGLAWKAIDAREKTQVGHYYLLQRNYAEAWRWYEQAEKEKPPAATAGPEAGPGFFHTFCLEKLGRHNEAEERRRRFEQAFLESYRAARKAPPPQPQPPAFGAAGYEPTEEQLCHWRDLYIAEVFLSLDAGEDGEAFFRKALRNARADIERLSKALVLTQLLLLHHKPSEYSDLATDTVLPLLLRSWKPRTPAEPAAPLVINNALLAYGDGLALLPLAAPEFLASLPEQQVRHLLPRWQEALALADDDVKRLVVDVVLQGMHQRLGQTAEAAEAGRRVTGNPVRVELLGDKGVPDLIQALRDAPAALENLRRLTAALR